MTTESNIHKCVSILFGLISLEDISEIFECIVETVEKNLDGLMDRSKILNIRDKIDKFNCIKIKKFYL